MNKTSAPKSFRVTNVGNDEIGSLTIHNPDDNFSIINNCSSTLAVGEYCEVVVWFEPRVIGNISVNIGVSSSIAGWGVSVSGTGLRNPNPTYFIEPDRINFGTIFRTFGTVTKRVTIENNNDKVVNGLTIGATFETDNFTKTDNCSAFSTEFPAGAMCVLDITFAPSSFIGDIQDNITIKSTNADNYTINLRAYHSGTYKTAAIYWHTLFLNDNNSFYVAGDDYGGKLGLGDDTYYSTTFQPLVVSGIKSWKQVVATISSSYAIADNGSLWAWGANSNKQLGLGNTRTDSYYYTPQQVYFPTGINGWKILTGTSFNGLNYAVAIADNGSMWSWGENGLGAGDGLFLGRGDIGSGSFNMGQIANPNGISGWKSVSANGHSLAIADNDSLWTWGNFGSGQLGLGDNDYRNIPTMVTSPATWKSVAAGGWDFSLGVATDGKLYSWGQNNSNGQLGLGDGTDDKYVPTEVTVDSVNSWQKVVAGYQSSYAIADNGSLWAWGENGNGQLGLGDTDDRNVPTMVPFPTGVSKWVDVISSDTTVIAITEDNKAYGWGSNWSNQLGFGETKQNITTPTLLPYPIN